MSSIWIRTSVCPSGNMYAVRHELPDFFMDGTSGMHGDGLIDNMRRHLTDNK